MLTVPSDGNIALKEMERKGKYKDLELEIRRMWHMKTVVIPCGCWCAWYSEEGVGRKHQKIIRELLWQRSKDLHAGVCTNPQEGAQCMMMHKKKTSKDRDRRDNNNNNNNNNNNYNNHNSNSHLTPKSKWISLEVEDGDNTVPLGNVKSSVGSSFQVPSNPLVLFL